MEADLYIQDELHLISGPLGTIPALYEAAIDALCSREVDGKTVRPKIVAFTATVRCADAQVKALFGRDYVDIFPPPGPDRRDSFFAVTMPKAERNARRYVGIAASGRSLKARDAGHVSGSDGSHPALLRRGGRQAQPQQSRRSVHDPD